MRDLYIQAALERLRRIKLTELDKPWTRSLGALKRLGNENKKIAKEIEEEFSSLN